MTTYLLFIRIVPILFLKSLIIKFLDKHFIILMTFKHNCEIFVSRPTAIHEILINYISFKVQTMRVV